MKERPILFSGLMVRAILDGRKTQTRRVIKPTQPRDDGMWPAGRDPVPDCHYGIPGDRLWVRETWCDPTGDRQLVYRADLTPAQAREAERVNKICRGLDGIAQPWRPSIFMPRWASRLTLELARVKVERLNDIAVEDAEAEGCKAPIERVNQMGCRASPSLFRELWESINGAGSWDANPWVWVVEFRRLP